MSLGHRLEAATAAAALWLVRRLRPQAASALGGAVARGIGPLLPVSRVADANLRRALPELDAAARARVIRGVWDNLGRTVAEMPLVAELRPTASGPGWELADEGRVAALAAAGGPAIFVTGHYGNWELLPAAAGASGIALSVVYRAAKNPRVGAMIAAMRARNAGAAVPHFPKGAAGARAAFGHLSRGGMLGLLMDQKLNDGIAVPFFGRDAMTAPSAAAFALHFRCPVLPTRVVRVGPARFRIEVEPPLALPDTGDRRADVAALTLTINQTLERWIRDRPELWLWLHRRWPRDTETS